jgi:hypothetical protein
VDLLEAYLREPPKEQPVTSPQQDPYLRAYGLSMFVDDYAPPTEVPDEMMSIEEADAMLAQLGKFLHEDLLRAGDLGSTRQIGESKPRSGLAVCISWKSGHRTQNAQ